MKIFIYRSNILTKTKALTEDNVGNDADPMTLVSWAETMETMEGAYLPGWLEMLATRHPPPERKWRSAHSEQQQ